MRDTQISLFMHGPPGASKSAVARQVADGLGIAFIDFRLTSVAPEDIRGVPFVNDAGGISGLVWTPPLVFPRNLDLIGTVDSPGTSIVKFYNPIGNNGIHYCRNPQIDFRCPEQDKTPYLVESTLDRFVVVIKDPQGRTVPGTVVWTVSGKTDAIFALEEFNSAMPTVMAASYQLVLDRRIGDYIVPHGVMLIAMGNRDSDKGVTFKIPKPVANRFVHIEMEISHEDWQDWAIHNDIHSDVVGYLAKWTVNLFDQKFAENPDHAFATPRSWEFVSKIISQPVTTADDKASVRALVCGAIGDAIGTDFLTHKEYMDDMPDVQDIFSGKLTTFNPKSEKFRTQLAYSTCVQICYELKKESDAIDRMYRGDTITIKNSDERAKYCVKADNAIGYAMDNFIPEVMVVFQRMAMQVYKLRFESKNMKNWKRFASENRNTLLPSHAN